MYAGFEHTYVYQTIVEEPISGKGLRFKFNERNYRLLKALDDNSDPFNGDAYRETTFLMAYSRKTVEPLDRYVDGPSGGQERKERWFDVVIRVIEGTMTFYIEHMNRNRLSINMEHVQEMAYEMAESFYKMHWVPPGRGLWAMGTEHTYRLGNASLNNCYATDVEKNLVKSLVWGMDMLMCGGGLSFTTSWQGKISRPNKFDPIKVVVPDSREGWCIALEMLLRAYIPDKHGQLGKFPIFDYSLVRPYGAPIKGFGGVASGPQPLIILLKRVEIFFDTYLEYNSGNEDIHAGMEEEMLSKVIPSIKITVENDIEEATKRGETDFSFYQRDIPEKLSWRQRIYLNMFEKMIEQDAYQTTKFNKDLIYADIVKHSNDINSAYTMTRLIADIANCIGVCVVSGGVRRSSEMLLGSPDDDVFINLKNYNMHPLRRPFMYLSNNTVRLWNSEQFEQYLPKICGRMRSNGEPGILNMINVKKYGRFSDETYGPDSGTLVNACSEIVLNSYEPCCLSVIAPIKCLDVNGEFDQSLLDNAVRCATLYAMIVTTIPHHWSITNKIIHKNHRIGVGMTGVVNYYERFGSTKTIAICKSSYRLIRETNKKYAAKMGIRESIRVSTIKPDGTIGLILGVSSGINFPICKHAKRRICYDNSNVLLKYIGEAGYEIEPSTLNANQSYAIFPICGSKLRAERDAGIYEKLALVELVQRHYSDNAVSVTIGFSPEREGNLIEQAVSMKIPQLKCLSVFPQYEGVTTQYTHLPFENITEEKYNELKSLVKPLDRRTLYGVNKVKDADNEATSGCTGDACSIKK